LTAGFLKSPATAIAPSSILEVAMRRLVHFCFSSIFLLLAMSPARSGEEPQAIIPRAVKALGGEANLIRARAVQAKIKGTLYDPVMKESPLQGAKFTGELIAQLPAQYKQSMQIEAVGIRLTVIRVLNGQQSWSRENEISQQDDKANHADLVQSAYVDYVASLVPLLKDKGYSLSSVGEVQIEGQPTVGIRVVSKGQPDVTLYFDKVSGLLLKSEDRRRDTSTNKVVKHEEFFTDYQEVNPARMEEQTLKAANVGSDDSALLEFLRKHTLSEEARKKITDLIRGLGNASFRARQRAKEDLIAQGITAVPLLKQALKDPDPEIVGLAKECLRAIGKSPDPALTLAAIRLLAMRKPAGGAEVLLGYLPSAPDEAVAQEVRAALAAVAFQDGKPDKTLVQALKDKDPQRQAAAAALLGSGSKNTEELPGQRLFLPGLKLATKGVVRENEKKTMDYELTDIQIFNKLDDSVFSKP
jgi:hypothetical protein